MRQRGGYNVPLAGKPSGTLAVPPEPAALYLPLRSRRFVFSQVAVTEGQRVRPGTVLARDPACFNIPMLAPRAGTVRLQAVENHIVLEDVAAVPEEPPSLEEDAEHVPRARGSAGMARYKLVELGAWQFFEDAHTGDLPDPFGQPRAVIVNSLNLEPFVARGDVQIRKRVVAFTRGLEQIQALLEYQPIYLVMPRIESDLAQRVRDHVRGYAWVQAVTIPLRYGLEHFAVLARHLRLKPNPQSPIWAVRTDGVLAIDRAITLSLPCTVRIVSLGGPGVKDPRHLKLMPGYPLDALLEGGAADAPLRVIAGGALTGERLEHGQKGLDAECAGLTVLAEPKRRELFGWLRPGWGRASYSRCFLSALHRSRPERLTTAMRGERRACIACGQCEQVCPARILPHVIHKAVYADALDDAERLGVDRCVGCGLCAYVCPSKIELRQQFLDAQARLREERAHAEAAKAEEVKG